MAKYTTINEFQQNHPRYTEAVQWVFVSDSGEIHQYIMPVESWHDEIKTLMTDYASVNGWKSIIHTIHI